MEEEELKKTLSVQLPKELLIQFRCHCIEREISMRDVILELIEEYLARQPK